jgi:hypothetical protein
MLLKNYLLSTFLLLVIFPALAQDAEKDFDTKSISIFKNGSAFFLKSGIVKTTDGSYRMTENIPAALFGTLWINSPNGELKHISSYSDKIQTIKKLNAKSFAELLYLNSGKKVKLHIGKDEIVEGFVDGIENKKDTITNSIPFYLESIVSFKTGDKWLTISTSEIRRVEFLEKPTHLYNFKKSREKPVVKIDFNSKKAEQPLDLMYLENGLSWSPNYLIELIDDRTANLTLRAEVVNNAENINDSEINFVVGIPNFRFANKLSSLVDFIKTFTPSQDANRFSNIAPAQTLNYGIEEDFDFQPDLNTSNNPVGSAQEDLYFYNLKNINLKKGGRGHYQIFKTKIEIAHIYECNLETNSASKNYYQKSYLFQQEDKNKVFHSVKLNNETNYPWTTGAAMVVKDTEMPKPISQDQLNYTPINGNSFVKLTQAPDVKVKHAEKEIERIDRAMKNPALQKYYLDLVTVEGKIKVKNYKSKKIDLNIRRTIIGQLLESSSDWLKSDRVNRSSTQNTTTDVCWETTIKPGEELIITYTYKVYVPD